MAVVEKKLYVGNLSYGTQSADLEKLFSEFGDVKSANVITDKETGRSKGFGFVEMATVEASAAAIEALNGKDFDGRTLTVNEAKPREDKPRTGGYSSSGRSSGGYGGSGRSDSSRGGSSGSSRGGRSY